MFILVPTWAARAGIWRVSRRLLDRYWTRHPDVVEVDLGVRRAFVGPVAEMLRGRGEEAFVLMLDDYGVCGAVKTKAVSRAAELMDRDPSIGLFALGWYPAARREVHRDFDDVEVLTGAPVLLQAGIWGGAWFVDLADGGGGEAGAWGFEGRATQALKRFPRTICAMRM